MTKLTFYGGVKEIGGNKILLEDKGKSILLDFGFPYKQHKKYYEEFLKPRSGAGILDPLTMGMLPPLEGLYREDIIPAELWTQFRNDPRYLKLEPLEGVLLSHAHLDHSAHISFMSGDIPVFSTAVSAFITKAMQDSGRADFDQQVCYYTPVVQDCPTGTRQVACLSSNEAKRQRQFCLGDRDAGKLSLEANTFWAQGFWERTARQKEIISKPLKNSSECKFNLRCFPVDHSIPGACAWGIETSSGWVIYSGDLRLHGKRSASTRRFIEQAAALHPRALIIEGTNIKRKNNVSEQEVYENALRAINGVKGLVIADFSAKDIDRLLTFLQIARDTNRKLAILSKDAYLLKTMHLLEPEIPDIACDNNIVIYQETTASKSPAVWLRKIYEEYDNKIILAEDVNRAQEEYIQCFSFFDLNELPSIRPKADGLYVYSSSEPHDEEQEIDFRRLHNWLDRFNLRSYGLPEEKDGGWQIPEEGKGIHASGHACGVDLTTIAESIHPELLIPVHSESPELYIKYLEGSGIDILLPEAGCSFEV
jgi:ribonuclease J